MRYEELTKPAKTGWGLNDGQPLFEMSNLAPDETGLPFTVFVSPGAGAQHGPRVKVTIPPWGSHPEGVYTIEPVACAAGADWLTAHQKDLLRAWIGLNKQIIEDFWHGRIHYDRELRAKIVPIGNAPPADRREAVVALRASAPKVRAVYWRDGTYYLTFNRHAPDQKKVAQRFASLGFHQPIAVGIAAPAGGILLWEAIDQT